MTSRCPRKSDARQNDYGYVGDPVNEFDLNGEICFSCAVKKVTKVVKKVTKKIAKRVGNAAKATGRWVNKNRWKLAGFGVSGICVASGGAGCVAAASLLFTAKNVSTARSGGGWRDYLVNGVSSYAAALPGLMATGPYNTVAWRALAEGPGAACNSVSGCANPSTGH